MNPPGQAGRAILAVIAKKILLILLPLVPALFLLMFILIFTIGVSSSLSSSGEQFYVCGEVKNVSNDVLAYKPMIEVEMEKQGLSPTLSNCLIAQVMQESGGRGPDIFQASESKYGKPGMIQTIEESIEQGVKRWSEITTEIGEKELPYSIDLVWQTYNFGSGFLNYLMDQQAGYSIEASFDFSQMMYEKLKGTGPYRCLFPEQKGVACYGDFLYVVHIKRYLEVTEGIANGNFQTPYPGLHHVVTSEYGPRWGTHHAGIDLVAYHQAPISTAADGVVVDSRVSSSYGNVITIQHENGLYTRYAHLQFRYAVVGQKVKQGQIIGTQGNTGDSQGSHLHFEIRTAHDYNDASSLNPRLYISFP